MRRIAGLAGAAFQAVTDTLGGRVLWSPMAVGDYTGAAADPSRAGKEGRAVVTLTPTMGSPTGSGSRVSLALRRASMWLSRSEYEKIGGDIRAGDLVQLLDETDKPIFAVAGPPDITDRGDARFNLVMER